MKKTTLLLIACVFALFCLSIGLLLNAPSYPMVARAHCTSYGCFAPPLNPWP